MIENVIVASRTIDPGTTLRELSPFIRLIEAKTGLKACKLKDFKIIIRKINILIINN
jgi:hypothetical protein